MDLVNVQKSNSSFSFLVFSSKIHRFLRLKCTDEWPVQKKSLEPKYLVVIIGDQSQRDSKLDWSLICYNFYFFYSAIQKIQKRQRRRGKSVSVLLKNADGFCSLQKAKNVSLWFANSANYTQKMWRWRISVGIEYSIIDSHPFWQFFRALLTGCYEQQKPIEFSSN